MGTYLVMYYLLAVLAFSTTFLTCNVAADDHHAAVHSASLLHVTDANVTSIAIVSNRTVESHEWDRLTILLFLAADPQSVDGTAAHVPASAAAFSRLSSIADAVVSFDPSGVLERHVQLVWAICSGTDVSSSRESRTACGTAQQYGLDVNAFPAVIVLGSDGNRLDAWERVQLLRQPPLHVAAHIASHVRPVVRRLYSVSDVTALPAALLEDSAASGESLQSRVVVVASSAPRTEGEDQAIRAVGAALRGVATLYVINGEQPVKELYKLKLGCHRDASVGGQTATPSTAMYFTVVRFTSDLTPGAHESSTCIEAPLIHSAATRAARQTSDKRFLIEHGAIPADSFERLGHLVNDQGPTRRDQSRHAAVSDVLSPIVALLYDVVEVAHPLRRDGLLARSPACTILHFIPNLYNYSSGSVLSPISTVNIASATAAAASPPPPLSNAVSQHVQYYASRHRRLARSVASVKCAVTLVDPQGVDKDLFLAAGYKHSDVFQTSASIRDAQGRSFSGKSRDNLVVLSVNNTFRFKFSNAYYDATAMEGFVKKKLAAVAGVDGKHHLKALTMMSSLPMMGSGTSSAVFSGLARQFPWSYVPSQPHRASTALFAAAGGKVTERRFWELEAPKWLSTVSSDVFERQVIADVTRDTVLLVLPSVHNSTQREDANINLMSTSVRLESVVGQVMLWVARWHPATHAALRFARIALDCNDVPRVLAPHISSTGHTVPHLFYISRNNKYDIMRDGSGRSSTPQRSTPHTVETLQLTDAEKKAAQPIRLPLSIHKESWAPTRARDELRDILKGVSPLQWVFDTRYAESSDNDFTAPEAANVVEGNHDEAAPAEWDDEF